jgi:hypothetical protein
MPRDHLKKYYQMMFRYMIDMASLNVDFSTKTMEEN